MKEFYVTGGIYTDFTFTEMQDNTEVVEGPFPTYEEASKVWKSLMWLNVDNALHRLQIKECGQDGNAAGC